MKKFKFLKLVKEPWFSWDKQEVAECLKCGSRRILIDHYSQSYPCTSFGATFTYCCLNCGEIDFENICVDCDLDCNEEEKKRIEREGEGKFYR